MSESTFTIEFPMHLPIEKRQYMLDRLTTEIGVSIEKEGDHLYRVLCTRDSQVQHVGWSLFHTHYNSLCKVVSTSGAAVTKASAYSQPHRKRHNK